MKNVLTLKNDLVNILQQKRIPLYEEELWCNKNKVIYGPVASRRLGDSVGVNFFPKAKICSFNCCYCDVHLTSPDCFEDTFKNRNLLSPHLLKIEIEKGITTVLQSGKSFDYITICGNGEATDYPFFVEIAEFLIDLRPKLFPEKGLAVLTNSCNIDKIEIREVLSKYDIVFYKLDAGDETTFRNINRPIREDIRFVNIIKALKSIKKLHIQTAVVDSPSFSNIQSLKGPYIEIIKEINPDGIYIHNIDYPVPYKQIRRLSLDEMKRLAYYIAERTSVPVYVLHSLISLRRKKQ